VLSGGVGSWAEGGERRVGGRRGGVPVQVCGC